MSWRDPSSGTHSQASPVSLCMFPLREEVGSDILDEIDGPLLEHGIKSLHNKPLMVVPRRKIDRPNPELLEIHYERFRAS